MLLPPDLRVLVVDGSRMLLLRNCGNDQTPDFEIELHRQCVNPPSREQLTGPPDLTLSRGSTSRDTLAEGDPHQANEVKFAIAALEAVQAHDQSSRLVVIAPARTLAILRNHYSRSTKARLEKELTKDLVKKSVLEIVEVLKNL